MAVKQPSLLQGRTDLAAEMQGLGSGVAVIGPGNLLRLGQGRFDLFVQPVFDAHVDEAGGNKEQQQRGDQGERDKGDHQLAAQPGAEGVAFAFQQDPGDVAADQVNEQDNQEDDDVDENEDQDVIDRLNFGADIGKAQFGLGEKNNQQERENNDDRLSLAFLHLRRTEPVFSGCFHRRYLGETFSHFN